MGKAAPKTSSDVIDLHELLIGYTKGADVNDFVQTFSSGDGTYLLIDRDGTAGNFNQAYVLNLHGVQTDVATLLENNQLVLV
ncbi:type I secretion C-terminal target domain-containing protein [Variovorax sp. E3]|uniref:type I secretion C-terminal target domain-containing protein n=1 Tax=Variovorax sp. E3 TaxID=1914993 RepID=UPI0027DB72A0|nr:type I secretion C-terminal target domain-containing protein [Variovorax sp. E3]